MKFIIVDNNSRTTAGRYEVEIDDNTHAIKNVHNVGLGIRTATLLSPQEVQGLFRNYTNNSKLEFGSVSVPLDSLSLDATTNKVQFKTTQAAPAQFIHSTKFFSEDIIDPLSRNKTGSLELESKTPYLPGNNTAIDTVTHINVAGNRNPINAPNQWTLKNTKIGAQDYAQYAFTETTQGKTEYYRLQVEINNPTNQIFSVLDTQTGNWSAVNNAALLTSLKARIPAYNIPTNPPLISLSGAPLTLTLNHSPLKVNPDTVTGSRPSKSGNAGAVIANDYWELQPIVDNGRTFNRFAVWVAGTENKLYILEVAADNQANRERVLAYDVTKAPGSFEKITPTAQQLTAIKNIVHSGPAVNIVNTVANPVPLVFALYNGGAAATQNIDFHITYNPLDVSKSELRTVTTAVGAPPAVGWASTLPPLDKDYQTWHLTNIPAVAANPGAVPPIVGSPNMEKHYAVWLKGENKLFRYAVDQGNANSKFLWTFDPQTNNWTSLNAADPKNKPLLTKIEARIADDLLPVALAKAIHEKVDKLIPEDKRKFLYKVGSGYNDETKDADRLRELKFKDTAYQAMKKTNEQAATNKDALLNQPTEKAKAQRLPLKDKVAELIATEKKNIAELEVLYQQIKTLYLTNKPAYQVQRNKVLDQLELARARLVELEKTQHLIFTADSQVQVGKTTLGLEEKPIPATYERDPAIQGAQGAQIAALPPGAYIVTPAQYPNVLANIKRSGVNATAAANNNTQTGVTNGPQNATLSNVVDVSRVQGNTTLLVMPDIAVSVPATRGHAARTEQCNGGILSVTANAIMSEKTPATVDHPNEFIRYAAIIEQAVKAWERCQAANFDDPILVGANAEEAKVWYMTWTALGAKFTNGSSFKPDLTKENLLDWEKAQQGKVDKAGNPTKPEILNVEAMKAHLAEKSKQSEANFIETAAQSYSSRGLTP